MSLLITTLILLSASLAAAAEDQPRPLPAGPVRTPVVVELFTSEGCYSCPAADRLLATLAREQPVSGVELILLSEHVDYWNRLGWEDPFSDAAYSKRQRWYSSRWPLRVYTPQAVVDGAAEVIGSLRSKLLNAVAVAAKRPKADLILWADRTKRGKVRARAEIRGLRSVADGPVDVYLALVEDRLETDVQAGENSGLRLLHWGVTRRLERIRQLDRPRDTTRVKSTLKAEPLRSPENARLVVFAQSSRSRLVLAAATTPLPPPKGAGR